MFPLGRSAPSARRLRMTIKRPAKLRVLGGTDQVGLEGLERVREWELERCLDFRDGDELRLLSLGSLVLEALVSGGGDPRSSSKLLM